MAYLAFALIPIIVPYPILGQVVKEGDKTYMGPLSHSP
jgi:hypothetical protein